MDIDGVLAKVSFEGGYSDDDKTAIKEAIKTAYAGSATFKTIIDNWLADAAHNLTFVKIADNAYVRFDTNKTYIDVAFFTDNLYINETGKAVPDTLLTGLIHELVHLTTRKVDNWDNSTVFFYKGDTVVTSNTIYGELGFDAQNSYISYDSESALLRNGFQYTNGMAIDRSVSFDRDWSTAGAGNSNDLLVGGASANHLEGGPGRDVLVGNGGNDLLDGGSGADDTVLLFGNPVDYDIRLNADGTWTSRHVRGSANEGTDTFRSLEHVRFAGTEQTFDLARNGLTFQRDIAFVVDETGSMGDDIAAVKATALGIVNALFAGGTIDARIGIVGFRDVTYGEPTTIPLHFTDQDVFADRQAAAIAAINSLFASGGGDFPESAFDGLLKALDGTMGEWRVGAGTKQIVVFTDATARDAYLFPTVATYAANIGVSISSSSSEALGSFGMMDTFVLDSGSGRDPFSEGDTIPDPTFLNEPLDPIGGGPATIQVFTIFIEGFVTPDPSFVDLGAATGGGVLLAANPDEVVARLLSIVTPGPVDTVAQPDLFILNESGMVSGSVFDDNGSGPDTGPSLAVALVNGIAPPTTGGPKSVDVLLPSGATAQILADGTVSYTPGPGFASMPTPDSGATNGVLIDSLNYTLENGNTVNVVFRVEGLDTADTLLGSNAADSMFGGNFNDVLFGFGGPDVLNGGPGNDTVSFEGHEGSVFVNLTLGFGAGNHAQGDTYISIENVIGGEAPDFIIGGSDVNQLEGRGGNDILIGSLGGDRLIGGDGADTASYEDNWGTAFVNLLIGKGFNNAAEGDTYQGIENVKGGLFDDFFIGDDGPNRLEGALGADTLVGNGGADWFLMTYAPGASNPFGHDNIDTILDFQHGMDVLGLLSSAFGGLAAVTSDNFVLGTEAGDGDDRLIYDQTAGALWFDGDGNGAAAPVMVAMLTNHAELAPTDFAVM